MCIRDRNNIITKKSKKNVVAILPICENMISKTALRPSDIVETRNGITVEIENTDAEGRLILADAVSYATDTYNPKETYVFASLTTMANRLHCELSSLCFTENNKLYNKLYTHCEKYGNRIWSIPPWVEYNHYLKSDLAKVKNCNYECGYMAPLFIHYFANDKNKSNFVFFDLGEKKINKIWDAPMIAELSHYF